MFRGGKRTKSPKSSNVARRSIENPTSTVTASAVSLNSLPTEYSFTRSHHLAFVFPSFEEFPLEFEAMRNVISDIQQYCFEFNMDIECTTFIPESERNLTEYRFLTELVNEPHTTVICFIGDRYGNFQLPLILQQQEFNAIRAAAVEISKDVKLLEQFYCPCKNDLTTEYHLKCGVMDKSIQTRLEKLIQAGAQRAIEDDAILQIDGEKSAAFKLSYIERVTRILLANPTKNIFVLRKFKDYETKDEQNTWKDVDKMKYDRVSNLKNLIAEKVPTSNRLPYMLTVKHSDPGRWLTGKDASVYERQLTSDVISAIKDHIQLAEKPSPNSSASATEAAFIDHETHSAYATTISPQQWIARANVDDNINDIIQRGLEKSVSAHFYGPHGSGKTAIICRLNELLLTKNCYVISRYANLTDTSIFANELFKNIFLKLCQMAKLDSTLLSASFHLSTVLSQVKVIMDKVDKPVFVLIDGANYVKFGRTLSETEKPLRKLFPRLSLIYTSLNVETTLAAFPTPDEVVEIGALDFESSVQIITSEITRNGHHLSSDKSSVLRQQLKTYDNNIALGQVQAFELLSTSPRLFSKLTQYLESLEKEYGQVVVRNICQMLVISPHGLTAAEIADGYRLTNFQNGVVTKIQELFSPLPVIVLQRIMPLLVKFVVEGRLIYRMRFVHVATQIRQLYIPTATDLIAINEIAAELFKTGPSMENSRTNAQSAGIVNFPPALSKETRSLRRLRFAWYYLLHSANIDELKSEALCAFEYIEGVFRFYGLTRLLTIFEECLQQVLHHDLLVLFEQILLPAIPTLIYDREQFVSEFINRLRYTRAMNSTYLNELIEQAMLWTDFYTNGSLLVPMTCWVNPPKMKQIIAFNVPFNCNKPVLQPTCNHQHLLISGDTSAPGSIYMYHIASQLLFKTFKGHTDRVTSFCTSLDGIFFTSTSWDCSVRVWSILQLECMKTIRWNASKVLCSVLSEDNRRLIAGSADSTARVIDLETGTVLKAFPDHTGPVVDLRLMSKDELLVTGSGDFAVMVWDISAGVVIIKMSGLMAPVTCLTVTSNDAFLAVACEDETLRVFSTVSSQELHELSGHDSRVNALCASIDDCKLFAATTKKVICYDIHNGTILETLECSLALPVTTLKVSDDNAFLLAACGNKVHMWDVNSIESEPVVNNSAALVCIELSLDERTAACGTEDGVLAVWDLDGCRCLWTTSQQKSGAVTALSFTQDSMFVISGSTQGTISLWEVSTGMLFKSFEMHQRRIVTIICFADGNNILSCDDQDTAFIWAMSSVEDPGQIEILSNFTGLKAPLFLRINDSTLVSHNPNNLKELNIWSHYDAIFTSKTKAYHADEIVCYHVNKSGTFLVTGSVDQSLKVWRLETGFLTQVLVGHEDVVSCCCMSEDGKTVASGGRDKLVIIWDAETGQSKLQFTAKGPVTAVRLTLDSSIVISADDAGWIEAHFNTRNQRLSSFNAHRPVQQLAISTEAHRILARLENTAQLPILCLHNTPAGSSVRSERHRLHTLISTTSLTNGLPDETGSLSGGSQRPQTSSGALSTDTAPATNISLIKAPPVNAPNRLPPIENAHNTNNHMPTETPPANPNNSNPNPTSQVERSSGSSNVKAAKNGAKRSRACVLL
ncbi:putative WD repeat-containing protein [Aphelenchoides besseyi]|nr:putative WD repeat-containing protein [Aphelenchoides besseyi]